MDRSKMGIGQQRGDGTGAPNSGQRNIRGTAGDVGQESGGERQNGPVPASRPDSDISTQSEVARNRNDGATKYPAE